MAQNEAPLNEQNQDVQKQAVSVKKHQLNSLRLQLAELLLIKNQVKRIILAASRQNQLHSQHSLIFL